MSTVSPGDLYQFAEPYLLSAFGAIITALLAWMAAEFRRRTGIALSQAALEKVNVAAVNAAGRILANQESRFAGMKIDVGSPLIAAEVPWVLTTAEAAIKHLGMTPERVANLILAKVGQLQVAGGKAVPPVLVVPKDPAGPVNAVL